MKRRAFVVAVLLLCCMHVAVWTAHAAPTDGKMAGRSVVVLDTDVGTDDAVAILVASVLPNVHIDYMITTKGNTTLEGATRNAVILKRYLGMDAQVVQGLPPRKDANVTLIPVVTGVKDKLLHRALAGIFAGDSGQSMEMPKQ